MEKKLPDSLYVVTKELTFDDNSEKVIIHYTTQQEKDAIQHITRLESLEKVLHIKKLEPSGTVKGMKPEFIDGHIKLVVISETADNVAIPYGVNLRVNEVTEIEDNSFDRITRLINHPQMETWLREDDNNTMKLVIAITTGCWTLEE